MGHKKPIGVVGIVYASDGCLHEECTADLLFKDVLEIFMTRYQEMRDKQTMAAMSCRLKTLSYIDNIAAAREAWSHGVEDALMLNTEGNVACTTIANLFLLKDGTLVTPARDQGEG